MISLCDRISSQIGCMWCSGHADSKFDACVCIDRKFWSALMLMTSGRLQVTLEKVGFLTGTSTV